MKYLLDTHTALWMLKDRTKLSKEAKAIIEDVSCPLCVSIISAWEIAIKVNIGKLNFNGGSASFLEKMRAAKIEIVGITCSYIHCVEALPLIHRDPFDRMLVATAKMEGLIILTADENIHKYDIPCVW